MSLDFDSARLPNPHLTEDHLAWRAQLRRFVDTEIMPFAEEWDEAGEMPLDLWPKAAEVGLLGLGYPEEYGGTPGDVWFGEIAGEELARVGAGGINASLMVHGIGLPPVINWGSEAMKAEIAPPILRGEAWIS
ncbi:MAG: acyl-CoA dehydrogenase family protein, partial [Cellvibrionales bacterium]